jgi:hypothetical protein
MGQLLYELHAKRAADERRSRSTLTITGLIAIVTGGAVFMLETPLESKAADWPHGVRP